MKIATGRTWTSTLDCIHANCYGAIVELGNTIFRMSETALWFSSLTGTTNKFATNLKLQFRVFSSFKFAKLFHHQSSETGKSFPAFCFMDTKMKWKVLCIGWYHSNLLVKAIRKEVKATKIFCASAIRWVVLSINIVQHALCWCSSEKLSIMFIMKK
jgi:hypothetical protein